jgi:hypothetical protein
MPAMGLTSADTNASDIPDFSINSSRFDFVGDFPDKPASPSSGTVFFNSDTFIRENQIWLDGDETDGTKIVVTSSDNGTLFVDNWNSGAVSSSESYNLTRDGQKIRHSNFSYEIDFVVTNYTSTQRPTPDDPNSFVDAYKVKYKIVESPETGGGLIGRIPIVGDVLSSADSLAAMVGWVGAIAYWFVGFLWEISLNLIFILFDAITLFISVVAWLSTTYGDVISSAQGFAKVFVTIPAIILSAVLAKFVFVGLSLLPTT